MKSLGYYLLVNIIKLKRVKKIFSDSPLDYQKLRNDDVHSPNKRQINYNVINSFWVDKTKITEVIPAKEISPEKAIIYCPGGAFVYGPTELNWKAIAQIVKSTGIKAFVLDYPKAPEHNILEINKNIEYAFHKILEEYEPQNITLIGDSVGGTLLTILVQRLLKNKAKHLPKNMVLISPVMDCSLTNPAIGLIDKSDIMLSKVGALSAKQMCAGDIDLKSPLISPLFSYTESFIPTLLFIAENDIMRPDAELFSQKLVSKKFKKIFGKGMPHNWPILPVLSEGKTALDEIIRFIKNSM